MGDSAKTRAARTVSHDICVKQHWKLLAGSQPSKPQGEHKGKIHTLHTFGIQNHRWISGRNQSLNFTTSRGFNVQWRTSENCEQFISHSHPIHTPLKHIKPSCIQNREAEKAQTHGLGFEYSQNVAGTETEGLGFPDAQDAFLRLLAERDVS